MSNHRHYGSRHWRIEAFDDGPVYICADYLEISETGALLAWGGFRETTDQLPTEKIVIYAWAPKTWHKFFAASGIDGHPVCAY